MIIRNGLVFRKNGIFEKADIQIREGVITRIFSREHGAEHIEAGDEEVLDAAGNYVVPGFVDIHTHGAVDHDFCDGSVEGLLQIAEYEKKNGVTSFCPTSMTLPAEYLEKVFRTAKEACCRLEQMPPEERKKYARIVGVHMEGPFLAEQKKGAQKAEYLRKPDLELFRRLQQVCGYRIRLITLAPELSGAEEFISRVCGEENKEKIVISLGHSAADYETAERAFALGACHVTHLYNAMEPMLHREPGIVGAAAENRQVVAELICDGYHVHPSVVRSTFRMFGEDRICLISDSTEATGMPDGEYYLGGQTVYKQDGAVRLQNGVLAGSASNLYHCFKKAIEFGIEPQAALKAVTCNPAASIGMADRIGVIEEGAFGDLLLLNGKWEMVRQV